MYGRYAEISSLMAKKSIIYVGSGRNPDGRFSPPQGSQLHAQTHPLPIHHSPHLHQSSFTGENTNSGRPGFPIQSSFLSPNSVTGSIPPLVRPLGLLPEEGRSNRISPIKDQESSKNFLERSLKNMANPVVTASTKADTKGK